MLCQNCKTENAGAAKFCANCGQPLAPPVQQITTPQTVAQQTTTPQATTPGEGRRILSLVAGALFFYVCLAIVSLVTDWMLPPDRSVSAVYVGSWFLGTGLASAFGVEIAKRVAHNFNRIGLVVLMVAPIAFVAIGIFLAADHFTSKTIMICVFALMGSAVGLGKTFNDMMKSERTTA